MSLKDALNDIADDMESECGQLKAGESIGADLLRSYAKQIRRAVKAAGDAPPPAPPQTDAQTLAMLMASPMSQNTTEIERARARLRAERGLSPLPAGASEHSRILAAEEGLAVEQVQIAGGPMDGDFLQVPAGTPKNGVKTVINGVVYKMIDGKAVPLDLPQQAATPDGPPKILLG